MHILQPKHAKLSSDETEKLLKRLNISLAQLPKISKKDPALPLDCKKGDVIEIERKEAGVLLEIYHRVVI